MDFSATTNLPVTILETCDSEGTGCCGLRVIPKGKTIKENHSAFLCTAEGAHAPITEGMPDTVVQGYFKGRQPIKHFHQVVETSEGPVTVWWSQRENNPE